MFKKIFCSSLVILLIILTVLPTAGAYTPTNFNIDAEGALLVNTDTGDILFSKNADKKLYPASLTKLMTALVLYENTADLDSEIITVSQYAVNSLQGTDSVPQLNVGEKLTVRQMLYVLLISSANDGANAIAEHVAGSVEAFSEKMNAKAAELGMTGTHFVTAHGLHDPNHYTTVNDMYKLTTAVLSVDILKEVCYSTKYRLEATNMSAARTFTTTNLMLLNNGQTCTAEKYKGQSYYYKYAKGVKTGYTDPAGRCLISTASKGGYNYMCILMNCPVYAENGRTKIRIEFGDTKALYEWAFNEFEYKNILSTDQIIGEAPVDLAWDTDFVSVVPSNKLSAVVPKVADSSTISMEIDWYKSKYDAPIKKGDIMGECRLVYAGEVLGTVTLEAAQDVERSTLMYIGRSVKNFTSALFSSKLFLVFLMLVIAAVAIFIISLIILNSPKHKRKKKRRF